MNTSQNDQLIAYLLGDLPEKERQEVEQELDHSPALQQELQELQLVLGLLDAQPEVEPSHYSRDQFYQFLEAEARPQAAQRGPIRMWTGWRAAAAVALLAIGIGFGVLWQHNNRQQEQILKLSEEVVETRKLLLLAMLQDPSASERIQAMNVSTRDFQADQRVMEALINRLQNDENINVRLKAAEALGNFMDQPGVAEAAIQSLELESSPEVQITLIESLVQGQRKEAVPGLRRLIQREDIPKVVRDLAAYGLQRMI